MSKPDDRTVVDPHPTMRRSTDISSSRRSSRSRRSSSARTGRSSACWSACCPAATRCSRACPAWPRRWPPRRSARVVGGTFARLQFTPDLLPADVMGTRIYRASTGAFDVELGPVFANFVLADEINRAPAKVQSALLEVMAERQVSIGGQTFPVPDPFLVLATQNPIEQEGVYPLPEAQRDRFLMKIVIDYPSPREEVEIVERMGVNPPEPRRVAEPRATSLSLQRAVDQVYVDRAVVDYAVQLVLATRTPSVSALGDLEPLISYGASPRASPRPDRRRSGAGLLRGRTYVLPQDVFDVAPDVLRHRLVLSYEALAQGVTADQILGRILSTVPAPRVAPSQAHDERHRSGRGRVPTGTGRGAESRALGAAAPPRPRHHRRPTPGRPLTGGRRPTSVAPRRRSAPTRSSSRRRARRRPLSRSSRPTSRRAPPRPGPTRCCDAWTSPSATSSTACSTATTRASCPATAPSWARPAPTSRATTSAASTGTSPPGSRTRTSATRSPTASWRRGSPSTCPPASSSAPRGARSGTWPSRPPRRSGS